MTWQTICAGLPIIANLLLPGMKYKVAPGSCQRYSQLCTCRVGEFKLSYSSGPLAILKGAARLCIDFVVAANGLGILSLTRELH